MTVILDYVNEEVSRGIRKEARRLGLDLNIAFRVNKIKDIILGLNSDKVNLKGDNILSERNIIYKLTCKRCKGHKVEYIGESKRSLNKRVSEHLCAFTDVNKRSQVYQYADITHGSCSSNDWSVDILAREPDELKRKIKESKLIGHLNPKLNLNGGITYIR